MCPKLFNSHESSSITVKSTRIRWCVRAPVSRAFLIDIKRNQILISSLSRIQTGSTKMPKKQKTKAKEQTTNRSARAYSLKQAQWDEIYFHSCTIKMRQGMNDLKNTIGGICRYPIGHSIGSSIGEKVDILHRAQTKMKHHHQMLHMGLCGYLRALKKSLIPDAELHKLTRLFD